MHHSNLADAIGFFKAWLIHPRRVAAIVPSGRALAALITSEISAQTGPVIELGSGTGVFTRALIERGVSQENLALIECDAVFAAKLERLFEYAHTVCMDAVQLKGTELFDGAQAGAVISGLPLLSMPLGKVIAILDGAFAKLKPDGAFYQFTYGPGCPIPRTLLDHLELKAIRVGRTFTNFPPASVYRIVRRQPRCGAICDVQRAQVECLSGASFRDAAANERSDEYL
jgi:phosphatidylethanolamine/phosphatidyl-N-methylethanolamine N-methyltransferase